VPCSASEAENRNGRVSGKIESHREKLEVLDFEFDVGALPGFIELALDP